MPRQGRFYLKVPMLKSGNVVWEHIGPIAIETLHMGVITTIFQKASEGGKMARSGNQQYRHAVGAEVVVKTSLDPSEILEALQEVFEPMQLSIRMVSKHGERIDDNVIKKFRLTELIQAIASADVSAAVNLIFEMNDALSTLCDIASMITRLEERVEELSATTTQLGNTLDKKRDNDESYLRWAEAITNYLNIVDSMETAERLLHEISESILAARQRWNTGLAESNPDIKGAIDFFEPEQGEGFILRALLYRDDGNEAERRIMEQDILNAQKLIQTCEALISRHREEWGCLKEKRDEARKIQDGFEGDFSTLSEATANLQRCQEEFRDMLNPHEAKGLLEKGEYERAIRTLGNHRWGPRTCRNRLRTLASSVMTQHGLEPELPEKLASALDQTRSAIGRIMEAWGSGQSVPPPSRRGSRTPPAAQQASRDSEPVDQARLDTLYELAIVVGHVATVEAKKVRGEWSFFSATSPKAILEVLVSCNRCTEKEAATYLSAFCERCDEHVERVNGDPKHVQARQQATGKHWVSYQRRKGVWALKLSTTADQRVDAYARRHGIDLNEIRSVMAERRAKRKAQHEPKR